MSDRQAWQEAREEVKKETCFCGLPKTSGVPFCRVCYAALPPEIRRTLYLRQVGVYVAMIAGAKQWLREHLPRVRTAE